ncbi:MAG: hypothetical protein LUG16_05465, partial [Candidatus Gastranaerophilales bacterium]|nr:hypothetical protein [Candidatus Gastranaerophilales bacterium]
LMNNEIFILLPEESAIKKTDSDLLKIINNKVFNDKILLELQSDFHDIKVIENEIGRFLHYADTYQAGFINTDFYKGNLPYINYFLIPFLINPDIENILLIGLGSGKIVNDFEFLFDKLKSIDTVDLEENIISIAEKFFDFKISDKFSFILQDGITYLRGNKKKYDLIVADVANNDGIDCRFLSQEYFKLIKKSLKKNGIFVSNMCASPDFKNEKNIFFKKFFPVYNKYFKNNLVFKGDFSDKVYYKSFFNLDKRVIDITNVIIISSDKYNSFSKQESLINKISELGVNINNYLNDYYYDIQILDKDTSKLN